MPSPRNIHDSRLADAWATLKSHADAGLPLQADASRLAFADPEFLLRRETRGIRFQLEMLKPDLEQAEHGIENTIVVLQHAVTNEVDHVRDQIEATLEVSGVWVVNVIAIGKQGDVSGVPAELQEREAAPRTRKSLEEIILHGLTR